jgi:hypothetical protein
LKENDLFKGIDPYYAIKLADGLNFKEVSKGEKIIMQVITVS